MTSYTKFRDSDTLGQFFGQPDERCEELNAAHERIAELKASLTEMLGIYWGEGDGEEPLPGCIQRAQAALNEDAR